MIFCEFLRKGFLGMAPSFDCVSSLLCTEDSSVFDDAQFEDTMEEDSWRPRYQHQTNQNHSVPDEMPLQSEECLMLMLEKECQQWPGSDYLNRFKFGDDLDFGARNEAIDWIQKVDSIFLFCFLLFLTLIYLMLVDFNVFACGN